MITIAKPIGETTMNGLEWLFDKDGNTMKFGSEEEAKEFLRTNGYKHLSDEQLEDSFLFDDEDE